MLASSVLLAIALTASDTTAARPRAADPTNVTWDTTATEIRVTIRGLHIAPNGYGHAAEQRVAITWPAGGWMGGYRIDVLDSAGKILPRETLHHAGLVNPERRQLVYPVAERLIGAGRETAPVRLPGRMGVPLDANQPLVAYFMLVNSTDVVLDEVAIRFSIVWTPASTNDRPRDTFPVFLDAKPSMDVSRLFDVPPGRTELRSEFTLPVGGRMRAMGAHVHDFAEEIRLEDVETGRTLVRIRPEKDHVGVIRRVGIAKFPFTRGGLRLEANHRYRVVAVYMNTSCTTVTGAMAFLAGPYVPDDAKRWPALDRAHPMYIADPATGTGAAPIEHPAPGGHTGHGGRAPTGDHADHAAPSCRGTR